MYEELTQRVKQYLVSVQGRPIPYPPAEQADIDEEEGLLGFRIPELLKSLYLNVGNGGFGPGSGGQIIGVRGGDRFFSGTLVEIYNGLREGAAWDGDQWIEGLLPFCGWGCNIFSCVDCSDEKHLVYQSEECVPRRLRYTLNEFVGMWLTGVEILDVDKAPRRSVDTINPFTGEMTRVIGRRTKKAGDLSTDDEGRSGKRKSRDST